MGITPRLVAMLNKAGIPP